MTQISREIDRILELAGNLAIKTANQYLDHDLKLGLLERLKLPEETDFSEAKSQLLALLHQVEKEGRIEEVGSSPCCKHAFGTCARKINRLKALNSKPKKGEG